MLLEIEIGSTPDQSHKTIIELGFGNGAASDATFT